MDKLKSFCCLCLLLCGCLWFVSCSTPIRVIVSNYEDSNLNNRGDNVPITLLIYQLKDGKRFEYASTKDLLDRESVVLGRDKVDLIRVQVPPDEKNMIVADINKKEGKYIGVLALFANPRDKTQKFYKKLNRVFRNTIKLDVTQNGIMKTNSNNSKKIQNARKKSNEQ